MRWPRLSTLLDPGGSPKAIWILEYIYYTLGPATWYLQFEEKLRYILFEHNYFRAIQFSFWQITDVAAELLELLVSRRVVANEAFLQNRLQASVSALADRSNNVGHFSDVLSQVLNNLGLRSWGTAAPESWRECREVSEPWSQMKWLYLPCPSPINQVFIKNYTA